MRPDDLRPVTAKAAAAAAPKLDKRRSKGERRYRKRFAEVGAVYDITPVARSPADVLASHHGGPAPRRPRPQQVGHRQRGRRRRRRRGTSLRRSRTTRPRPPAHLGRLRRREQPPDPPPPNRSPPARDQHHHRRRLHPRARVPVDRGVVLLLRRQRRGRNMGATQSARRSRRTSPSGRRRHPPASHRLQAPQVQTPQSRHVRRLPHQQGSLPRLPARAAKRAGRSPPE